MGNSSSSGRATGTDLFEDFECLARPRVSLSKEYLLVKVEELRKKLFAGNEQIQKLTNKVEEKAAELRHKERQIRSFAMRNVELERKLQQQQMDRGEYIGNSSNELLEFIITFPFDVIYKLFCLIVDQHEPVVAKLGPPMKDWEDLGQCQKRKVTQRVVDQLNLTAQERNVEPVKLVGSILRR